MMNVSYFSLNFLLVGIPVLGIYYKTWKLKFQNNIEDDDDFANTTHSSDFDNYLIIGSAIHLICWMTKLQLFERT